MKRKVIKLGSATLVTSLPSKWIKKLNLKAGDEIDIEEDNNDLRIQAKKGSETKKEITIELKGEEEKDIYIILIILYRNGFQRIKINNLDKKALAEIKRVTYKLLLGFELIDIEENSCVLDNLAEPSDQKYDILLRRIFLTIKETVNKTINDFEQKKLEIKDLEELKDQHDKFINFCKRIVIKENDKDITVKWELLTFLLHIQHALFYFYKYVYDNKVPLNKDLIDIVEKYKDYFQLFYDGYFNKDLKTIQKITHQRNLFQYGIILDQIEKKGKSSVAFSFIREVFRLTQVAISPIITLIHDY